MSLSCGSGSPTSNCSEPAGWPPPVCAIERRIVKRSEIFACRGNSSVTRSPLVFV